MHNESLPIRRAVGDRRGEAITLNNIGQVYRSLGETQKALEKYNESLLISRAVGDRRAEASTLHNIGGVYQSLEETQKALEKYNEALSLWREVGDRNGEADTLQRIARVEQKRGNLTQARQVIEQSVSLVESLRTNIAAQEFRASYFASRQEFFETYIDVLMEQRRQHPAAGIEAVALAVSERARARSLLELLTESRADIRQGIDSQLLERERSLQQRLNTKAARQVSLLNRKHTPEQADAAAKEIASITTEYEELQGKIRTSSPRYAALTQPQPLKLTRGFMYAGAPRIVASLWKVDDRATSELMKRFYQGLLGPEALRPAAALRQAQLSIWKQKQWRAPYYWAAFVLQGEWK